MMWVTVNMINQITNQQWHANCILCDSHGKSIYYYNLEYMCVQLWTPKIPYGWYLLLFISHFCSLIVAVCASLAVIYHIIINVYMMDDIYHNASYVSWCACAVEYNEMYMHKSVCLSICSSLSAVYMTIEALINKERTSRYLTVNLHLYTYIKS